MQSRTRLLTHGILPQHQVSKFHHWNQGHSRKMYFLGFGQIRAFLAVSQESLSLFIFNAVLTSLHSSTSTVSTQFDRETWSLGAEIVVVSRERRSSVVHRFQRVKSRKCQRNYPKHAAEHAGNQYFLRFRTCKYRTYSRNPVSDSIWNFASKTTRKLNKVASKERKSTTTINLTFWKHSNLMSQETRMNPQGVDIISPRIDFKTGPIMSLNLGASLIPGKQTFRLKLGNWSEHNNLFLHFTGNR